MKQEGLVGVQEVGLIVMVVQEELVGAGDRLIVMVVQP
jgi:hypothetical protein